MSEKKKHPIVFRFASVFPAALARIEMHAKRSGGPLENIELQFMHRNKVYVGQTFAEEMRAEIREMKQKNMDEEVEACLRRKRKKDAAARKEVGLVDPWHGNSQGPIREAIVTANWEYFEAENLSRPDDLLVTYGVDKNGQEVVHTLSKAKIAAFEEATLKFFDKYFPESVRHLRMDLDEEAPHFHAVIFETAQKSNKSRGTQRLIQPSAHPLLADYELLQDVAGEHFSAIGLVRGQKHAQEVRDAKESELPLPDSVRHIPPREFRNARARAIRVKELRLKEQEATLDYREAHLFLDEVAADLKMANANSVEREASRKEHAAQEELARAKQVRTDADAYAEGMTEGLEAIIAHQIDYQPEDESNQKRLCDGPAAMAPDKQSGLWDRIRPAYDSLLKFAMKAALLRERIYGLRRSEEEVARRAKIVVDAEHGAGRTVDEALAQVKTDAEDREYEELDFPGAWAIQDGTDPDVVEKRLVGMTNRVMRSCYFVTRDAAEITAEGHAINIDFVRGQNLLEHEAGRRGFDLDTGRHNPKAASDPERARLHTDQDTQSIKVIRRDNQSERTGH